MLCYPISSAGLDCVVVMEAHFSRKALATHGSLFTPGVLLVVLNHHSLSQKCIGSRNFDCLSICSSASNSLSMIHTLESPEEHILCSKRIADCVLYGSGTVEKKKKHYSFVGSYLGSL